MIEGRAYIPSKRAAEITGYAKDYIGQLCREGRVEAKLVGRSWYVLESSIREHRFGSLEVQTVDNLVHEEEPQKESVADQAPSVWQSPTYTTETVEEVVPITKPTFLANTPSLKEEKVSDLQSSWEKWFAHPVEGSVETQSVESLTHEELREEKVVHEVVQDPEPLPPEPIEEMKVYREDRREPPHGHVLAITQRHVPSVGYTLDTRGKRTVAPQPLGREKPTRRRAQKVSGAGVIGKALFVAFLVVVVAIASVGTGFFDSNSVKGQFASPIIDFIGGVERASK